MDVETVEDFLKIYDQHRERIRAKIKKCIEVLIFHLKILSKLDLSCCMGRSAKCGDYRYISNFNVISVTSTQLVISNH